MTGVAAGRLSLGILVSGRGSNMLAVLEAAARGELAADVVLVVSDRAGAPAIGLAAARGVPTRVLEPRAFTSRAEHEDAVARELESAGASVVVLAGYMRIVGPGFLARFPGRVINVHPSLLPEFPGLRAIERALAAGVAVTGCTVHVVDEGVDTGPVLAQRRVEVLRGDDAGSLAARVLVAEHAVLVDVLRELAGAPA